MAIRYQFPFHEPYKIGTPFGKPGTLWKSGYHTGLDLLSTAAGGDGRVYPVAPGKVIRRVVGNASYGNYVTVQHADGMLSLYAHLDHISVTLGQQVGYDTVLGFEGATGNATGPHLHLELHEGAYHYPATIDPAAFIEARQEEPQPAKDNDPDGYAADAVAWALSNGLLRGDDTGNLHLHDNITRQDAVVLLYRMSRL